MVLSLPCVVHSPFVPARGTTPLSTLIPGMMPLSIRILENGVPLSSFWYSVSWKRITPEICSDSPLPVTNYKILIIQYRIKISICFIKKT